MSADRTLLRCFPVELHAWPRPRLLALSCRQWNRVQSSKPIPSVTHRLGCTGSVNSVERVFLSFAQRSRPCTRRSSCACFAIRRWQPCDRQRALRLRACSVSRVDAQRLGIASVLTMSAALQGRARVGRAHSALARRSITRVRAAPSLPDPSSLPSLEEINAAASSLSSADATSSVTEAASALPPEVMYVGLGAAGARAALTARRWLRDVRGRVLHRIEGARPTCSSGNHRLHKSELLPPCFL